MTQADKLRCAAQTLLKYADVLDGKEEDFTGMGLWEIFKDQLREAMQVDVISNCHCDGL